MSEEKVEEVREDVDKWSWYKNIENLVNFLIQNLPLMLELLQEIKKLLESIEASTHSS